jgi:hypothetical protein
MKKLTILSLMLALLLSSCSSIFAPPPTSTPTATSTLTITPSSTATPSPTITPSPTETPDPNRPADATGRDKDGYYKDVLENGKTVRYYWVDLDYGVKGWFTSHILDGNLINGGIPLIDCNGNECNLQLKMIPFYFYAQEGLQAPFIWHPQNKSTYGASDLSSSFSSYLMNYSLDKVKRPWSVTPDEVIRFYSDFPKGKISFPFTTPFGNYAWRPSISTGYKFYAVKWDDADPAIHPEFYQTSGGGYTWRWTIFSDSKGNLIGFAAEKHNEPNDSQMLLDEDNSVIFWIFQPMLQMLALKQLPAKIKYWQDTIPAWNFYFQSPVTSDCGQASMYNPNTDEHTTIDYCVTQHFEIFSSNTTPTPIPTETPNSSGLLWDFNENGHSEGWQAWNQLNTFQVKGGILYTKSTGNDPYMGSPKITANASALSRIEIRMKVSAGDTAELYFITKSDGTYDESKVLRFPITADGEYHTYILDMSKVQKWSGIITQIRLDPTITQAAIEIDYIHILP